VLLVIIQGLIKHWGDWIGWIRQSFEWLSKLAGPLAPLAKIITTIWDRFAPQTGAGNAGITAGGLYTPSAGVIEQNNQHNWYIQNMTSDIDTEEVARKADQVSGGLLSKLGWPGGGPEG
jgi:hypothetical protein